MSNIIAAHPDSLELLITGGFPLLAQAPLRWAMAHTVNLGQAFRIAGLDDAQQEALLSALVRLDVPAKLAGADQAAMSELETSDGEPTAPYASDQRGSPRAAGKPHGHY